MKAFIAILAFVATVSAEADPVLLYNGYGTAVYGAYAPFNTVYQGVALKSAPCVNARNEPTPCAAGYSHYAYAPAAQYISSGILGARLLKREAEAEPAIFYNALGAPAWAGAYSSVALSAYNLKAAPCVNNVNMAVPCAAGYSYYAPITTVAAAPAITRTVVSSPVVAASPILSLAKREAEAEPVLLYNNLGTAVYGAYAPFRTVYQGVALKSAPCVNARNEPTPCAAGYSHYAYAPAAQYISSGILGARLLKREAEADAEPAIFYNALGAPAWAGAYSTLALKAYGLKSAPCVNDANLAVPCAAGYSYYAPLTVAAAPAITKTVVSAPAITTKTIVSSPITTSAVVSSPAVLSIAKRDAEAEADPAYFYNALPYAGVYGAYGYGMPYAAGLIHTSRLGVCLNYVGAQVPC